MTEFVSGLLAKLVLTFVAALSALGDGNTQGQPMQTLAVGISAPSLNGRSTANCPALESADPARCAAARMRWQITLHGRSSRSCNLNCAEG